MTEDVYFYLDLTKDLLRKKEIIKTIKYYIEEKNKANLKGHYSLLIFQEEGNPVFLTDKKNSDIIANSIEENWNTRPKDKSFFENGLFYIFSYIAETVRKKSKFNRIIVVTDTPSDLSEEYQEALFNLVSKIKNFPTFIDIIRVSKEGERFFKDDVKLNVLASDTKGGIFYVQDRKGFTDVIKKLVKTKQFVTTFEDRPDLIRISKEDYAFYNQLAKSLNKPEKVEGLVCKFCGEEVCPVCTDVHDIPIVCEDCNTSFHHCCITNYVINHNIGIPNIFRCPNNECDVLLKIDEDEIIEVSGEVEVGTVKEYLEEELLQDSLEEIPEIEEPISISPAVQKIKPPPVKEKSISGAKEVKTIRIGGFFGKVYTVKKVGDKIVYEKSATPSFKPSSETAKRGELIPKDTIKLTSEKSRKRPKFFICPQCGTQNDPNHTSCSNCGNKLLC